MSGGLSPGTAIGQRFVIEAAAGSGGMGAVYRARDIEHDELVAIKVLRAHVEGNAEAERFAREVGILAELRHPGIVSYIAHGFLDGGQPYLVMEWLEGEDLARRLRRGLLSPQESLTLISHIATALEVAHQQHIIHRDLKPSNFFLRHGEVEQVTLLDFGIARRSTLSTGVTRTGLIIGTPDYMAPEQARGQRDITPSADIFSLGCVLFECLTGQPPFVADVVAGVMAKLLFQPAPRLRSRVPEMPEVLDDLLARMLDKEPAGRPQDASELREALSGLDLNLNDLSVKRGPRLNRRMASATPAEQQLVSVLLSSVPSLVPDWDSDTNVPTPADSEPAKDLERQLAVYGAKVEVLADGSIVATVTQRSHMTATDLVAQAARCALALKSRFPDSLSTLTTGRGLLGGNMPIGEAIERSVRLRELVRSSNGQEGDGTPDGILLDEVTARLLDTRFELRRLANGVFALQGERVSINETRSLLGRPTQCVGRDRELAFLELLFAECRDDATARVALVTAPAGMGKSRLRHEFLRRLQSRGEVVQVFTGRGDPLSMGSPYALLGQALRQLCGILDGEDTAAQQAKLWQHVRRRLPEPEVRRVVEFIGELCGLRFMDADSVQLRAAREDARIMTEQLHRAFIDLLRSECDQGPLVLILEDLHWGDAPTVRLIDAALRELVNSSLMVLALARPEIETIFPRLWVDRRRQDLRLEGLSKKASERLVRQALGAAASGDVINRVVEQSAGNALFLEELIRAVAEGKGDELPETVLAMLQSRLLRLEPGARRLLRAASIFGLTFWRGGIIALLRTEPGSLDVDRWLRVLIDAEILELQRESIFPRDPQYRFRHALLRDAAYSLLTAEYMHLGHRLAAQYLEQMDESDPVVLAEHCERGNDPARASSLYLRAAELAHRRGDADTAVALAKRGLGCGPDEIARLGLLVVLCQVHLWRNEWALAAQFAEEVMRLSEPGSPSWAIAAAAKLVDARYVHSERFGNTLEAIRSVEPEIDAVSTMAFALAIGIYMLDSAGEFASADSCLQRVHEIVEPVAGHNPIARAWMTRAHVHREAWVHENPWAGLCYAEETRASFQEANHTRGALDAQVFIGMNAWYLGAAERAELELRGTLAIGEGLGLVSSLRTLIYIQVLCERGAFDEAEREARALAERSQSSELARGRGMWGLAEVLYRRGEHAVAEQLLRQALSSLFEAPLDSASAYITLARIQLTAGRAVEAVDSAEEALRRFKALGTFAFRDASIHLVLAESLHAAGSRDEARRIVHQAIARFMKRADKVGDAVYKQSFIDGVLEHQRLIALATAWDAEL